MDKLLSGLALALVSGITFLAYKHPKAYEKLHPVFMAGVFTTLVAAIALDIGGSMYFKAMIKFVQPDKIDEASMAAQELAVSLWAYLGCALASIYPSIDIPVLSARSSIPARRRQEGRGSKRPKRLGLPARTDGVRYSPHPPL
jgi:hypothetical protein